MDNFKLRFEEPTKTELPRGFWFYGVPGAGKSHFARELHPDAFIKSQSKWWDGYNGQEHVILDDLDSDCLGHHLKIWADKWPCSGEVKGGTVPLMYKSFTVTSNYRIDELFRDHILIAALERRFVCQSF